MMIWTSVFMISKVVIAMVSPLCLSLKALLPFIVLQVQAHHQLTQLMYMLNLFMPRGTQLCHSVRRLPCTRMLYGCM